MDIQKIREQYNELKSFENLGSADLERYTKSHAHYETMVRWYAKLCQKYRYFDPVEHYEVIQDEYYDALEQYQRYVQLLESSSNMFHQYGKFCHLRGEIKKHDEQMQYRTQELNKKTQPVKGNYTGDQLSLF